MEYKFNDEMKLKLVNENEIRCTITKNILKERKLNILELVSNTEKSKKLYMDIFKQATFFLNWDAEDIPLMIEAMPIDENTTVLIIKKDKDFISPQNQ